MAAAPLSERIWIYIIMIIFFIVISSPFWIAFLAYKIFSKKIKNRFLVWVLTAAGFILGIVFIIFVLSKFHKPYIGFG